MVFKRHKQYRLPGYDYSSAGAYFITICTRGRQPHLGAIHDGEMHYSAIGRFVVDNINGIEDRLPHLQVNEWVVMPDHIHLVLTIHPRCEGYDGLPEHVLMAERAAAKRVPTVWETGLRPLVAKSVESFINHFKGRVTRWCGLWDHREFGWQARFHDRIIRDLEEYRAVVAYVQNNVSAWDAIYARPDEPFVLPSVPNP